MDKKILHIDMNKFYATVEQMLNPSLKGKAIAVCGSTEERHGIVLTASAEAKAKGVKTGMANWEARQACPGLIVIPPQYDQYCKYSHMARAIYKRYSDRVESFGMDECWADITPLCKTFDAAAEIADEIRLAIKEELGLTVSIPYEGGKFIVADFSAIEARVIAWMAGEQWRLDVFKNGGDIYCASASQMFHVPVQKHGINGHLRQKGKIAELALGYGGSVGALKAMGALEMGIPEEELKPLVDAWRASNPNITQLWWDVDEAVKETVSQKVPTETHGIRFVYESGFLFTCLPSGRRLAYVKPRIGENKFGGESVTYEGIGGTKKWERLESYGPKFVENIVQALSRDILCYALKTLRCCNIVAHVHDEIIIECSPDTSLGAVCDQMGRTPPWGKGLILRADGYETQFYKKD